MRKYWVSRAKDQDIKDLLNIGYKLKAFTDKIYLRYQEAGIDDFLGCNVRVRFIRL